MENYSISNHYSVPNNKEKNFLKKEAIFNEKYTDFHSFHSYFVFFKKRVFHWCKFFKLYDWQIIVIEDKGSEEGYIADCEYDVSAHTATIRLYNSGIEEALKLNHINIHKILERKAVHESIHILTAEYHWVIDKKFEEDFHRIQEIMAVRLTNALIGEFENE